MAWSAELVFASVGFLLDLVLGGSDLVTGFGFLTVGVLQSSELSTFLFRPLVAMKRGVGDLPSSFPLRRGENLFLF